MPNVKRLPRGKRCGEASLHQGKRQDLKQEVRAYGVLPLFPHAETGADWYGGMGEGVNCFPSECSMPQRVRGLGKRIYALWGGRRGNLRSPPIAALKQFPCCRHGPADTLHERRAFYGEEPCASASGLIWWASDWLRALWAEHETLLNGEGDSGRLCWPGSSC